jgi:hypothetical protein
LKPEVTAYHYHSSNEVHLNEGKFMSPQEIKDFKPHSWLKASDMPYAVARAKTRMEVAKVWSPN